MCIVRGSDPIGRKGTTTVKTGQRRPPAAPMENLCAEDRVQIVAEKAPLVGGISAPLRILSACPVAARCGQSSWQKRLAAHQPLHTPDLCLDVAVKSNAFIGDEVRQVSLSSSVPNMILRVLNVSPMPMFFSTKVHLSGILALSQASSPAQGISVLNISA